MSDLDKQISDALDDGAKYLAMGEIAANTGLLVSPAPIEDTDYDIIVNNIDLSKGCMIEVVHSRDQFKGNIRGTDFDFLIFVYAPSNIENGVVKPSSDKEINEKRGMYVFPKADIKTAIENGTEFNPENIKNDGVADKHKYEKYRDAFHLISEMVPNSPPGFV